MQPTSQMLRIISIVSLLLYTAVFYGNNEKDYSMVSLSLVRFADLFS